MINLPKYSFDTHTLVWYFENSDTLSKEAKSILDDAFLGNCLAFVSSMVLLEAFHISLKDKDFLFPEFVDFLSRAGFIIISLDEDVLKIGYELPRNINIHDRVIISTAILTGSKLVTKDRILRSAFPHETIW